MPSETSDVDFLIKCFQNSWKINDYPSGNWIKTEALYDQYNMSIVSFEGKDIGYFRILLDKTNEHIGVEIHAPAGARPRHMYWLVKCAVIRTWAFGRWKYPDWKVEVNTWHPAITRWVRELIPELREHVIYDTYRILFCEMKEITKTTHDILDRVVPRMSVPDFNFEIH